MHPFSRTSLPLILTLLGTTAAATPCFLTPDELQAATGREFGAGTSGKDIATQEPQCAYRETKNPKRVLMILLLTEKAPRRFEAHKRVVNFSKDPIELGGVGDAAFYTGTTAGVLLGEKAVILSRLRGAGDPQIEHGKVLELLRKAAERLE